MPSQPSEAQPNLKETSPLLQNSQPITPNMSSTAAQQPTPVNTDVKDMDKNKAPGIRGIAKADTNYSWATPVGLEPRTQDDDCLIVFRRAVGINSDRAITFKDDDEPLEKGRKQAVGVYRSVIRKQRSKRTTHHVLGVALYFSHFLLIVLASILTALGPNAKNWEVEITVLGAINTVVSGVLAVLKGSGVIEKLAKDEIEFKKLQDWIEETEALLAVGVLGQNRKEVGVLVEVAFKKYNSCFGQSYETMSSSDLAGVAARRLGREDVHAL